MDDQQSAFLLYEEAMAFTYAAALRAVAALGVADHLSGDGRTVTELAATTGTEAAALRRIVRLLAGRGIFHEGADGRVRLTAKARALRSDAAVPARSGILMFTDPMFWTTCNKVEAVARDGRTTFTDLFGMSISDYFARFPETETLFYDGMATVSEAENALVAGAYDFPAAGTVADIGGGSGGFLRAVLRRRAGLRGVLFDQEEHVLKNHVLGDGDLTGRWEIVRGDFLAGVPAADVYLLKRILHNWDDERCAAILDACRRAMRPDGRVIVVDALIPPGNQAHQSKPMDFMMLAARTGRERGAEELDPLFTAAGLRLTRVIPTASVMSIAEGVAH